MPITRQNSELTALAFLRDHGPHTMGPIGDDGAFAAAIVFSDLAQSGHVDRTSFGNGHVQYSITAAGLQRLADAKAA